MILKKDIVLDTNPSLREKCSEVSMPLDEETCKILDDMIEYLENSQDEELSVKYDLQPGVGIAAPQIGINKRMFAVLTYDEKGQLHKYALVNPKIISTSAIKTYLASGEGCLSVPGSHQGYVRRYNKIKIKAYDYVSKKDVLLTLKGYVAVVVQHEYDHLDGILYYDRINKFEPFSKDESDIEIL